jgi:hypothetical protein
MMSAIKAGLSYWALVFALGFLLGTVRNLWLAPMLGDPTLAVLIELPFMLLGSWYVARLLVDALALDRQGQRVIMGLLAFILLLGSEAAVGHFLFAQSWRQWLDGLFVLPGVLGLFGQLLFALIPSLLPLPRRTVGD